MRTLRIRYAIIKLQNQSKAFWEKIEFICLDRATFRLLFTKVCDRFFYIRRLLAVNHDSAAFNFKIRDKIVLNICFKILVVPSVLLSSF